jgi:hypothetical protein
MPPCSTRTRRLLPYDFSRKSARIRTGRSCHSYIPAVIVRAGSCVVAHGACVFKQVVVVAGEVNAAGKRADMERHWREVGTVTERRRCGTESIFSDELHAEADVHRRWQDAPVSVLRSAAQGAPQEPHTRVCPAEEIDLVAGEIDASQKQIGDRLHRIERKSDAQVFIGEQLLDDHSNASS